MADAAPVKRARERGQEIPGDGQREKFGQRDRRRDQFDLAPARLDGPGLAGRTAGGPLPRPLHGVAEFFQKLEIAADVFVGHLLDHTPTAEQTLQFRRGKRVPGTEEDVDQVENPQQLLVATE